MVDIGFYVLVRRHPVLGSAYHPVIGPVVKLHVRVYSPYRRRGLGWGRNARHQIPCGVGYYVLVSWVYREVIELRRNADRLGVLYLHGRGFHRTGYRSAHAPGCFFIDFAELAFDDCDHGAPGRLPVVKRNLLRHLVWVACRYGARLAGIPFRSFCYGFHSHKVEHFNLSAVRLPVVHEISYSLIGVHRLLGLVGVGERRLVEYQRIGVYRIGAFVVENACRYRCHVCVVVQIRIRIEVHKRRLPYRHDVFPRHAFESLRSFRTRNQPNRERRCRHKQADQQSTQFQNAIPHFNSHSNNPTL